MKSAAPEPTLTDLRPGQRVGPFTLLRQAGRGAVAEVFLASEGPRKPPVALKLLTLEALHSDQADEVLRRFAQEVETARRLKHPDVVRVLASGKNEGRPWMAMEWLSGHDLTRYIQPSRLLPEAMVVDMGIRLASALAYAHAQGVTHRDLKPANVRVDLPQGLLKLTDFGVARVDGADRTATGLFLGTPAYMAPEVLAGAPATAQTDLYALGVLLFELLTGRRPHEASTLGELLKHMSTQPAQDLRRLRPELPDELARVLAQALARDPADRCATGEQLAQALALARVQLHGPVFVARTSTSSSPI